ncbi:MAG TPA: zinc-ribbon domain-containing protein [Phycisphaerae bacterium]
MPAIVRGEAPWLCFAVFILGVYLLISLARRGGARRCARCQEINRPYSRFCAHCGAPLR